MAERALMPKLTIPLVFGLVGRSFGAFSQGKDQIPKDVVYEVNDNPITQSRDAWVRGRQPEVTAFSASGSGAVTSVLSWTGKGAAYVVYARGNTNSNIYVYDGANSTDLGAITGQGVHLSETLISGVPAIVVISTNGGGRAWFYVDGGSLTEITDTDYPPKQSPALTVTGNAVHLNGRMYVMCTNGQIWASDINSLSAWTATNVISAQKKPDLGVGLMRYKDYIAALGKTSLEVLRDTGNSSGSQLSSVTDGFINVGCTGEHAMIEWDDSIAWIGATGNAGAGVNVLTAPASYKTISNDFIDQVVETFSNFANARLYAFQSDGKQFLALDAGPSDSSGIEYVYQKKVEMWTYWLLSSAPYKTSPHGTVNLIAAAGGVYKNSTNNKMDYSVQTGTFNMGTRNKKVVTRISVIGDAITSADTVSLYNDDYTAAVTRTFNTAVPMPAGHRWGMGRAFAVKLSTGNGTTSTTSTPRKRALEIEYEVCAG